jgi:replicative DNA helicase
MVVEIRPGAAGTLAVVARPHTVRDILTVARHSGPGPGGSYRSPIATGFDLLDRVLEGGLRLHDLLLLGGGPGVGKTIAALQMARHAARAGRVAVYVSYEHDEAAMLGRLLVLELGMSANPTTAPDVDRLRAAVVAATSGYHSLDELISTEPLLADAAQRVDGYADRLWFVRGSGAYTDVAAIEALLPATGAGAEGLLVIDYLQKVAVHPAPTDETEKVTRVAEGLKDLALRHDIACIALVAADTEGISSNRVRLHHLRGSSALGYECDVAVMMNDKHRAVSRVHLTYDTVRAERFHHQAVFSVEKNRGGPAMVDLEFDKDFLHYRFVPGGRYLAERLADDRLAVD